MYPSYILPILSLLLMVIPLTQTKHDFPSAAPSSVDVVASTSLSSQVLKDVPLGRDKNVLAMVILITINGANWGYPMLIISIICLYIYIYI